MNCRPASFSGTIILVWLGLLGLSWANPGYGEEDRRDQLANLVDEELREVVRLNQQYHGRDATIMLRMAELYLEKARIAKEKENEAYLSINSKERSKVRKDQYFKKSNANFRQAQKICERIVAQHPRLPNIGEVYYIMAFNAKEFQEEKKAQKYFALAIKHTNASSPAHAKSLISLAEINYNNGQYKAAVPLYEKALRLTRNDKWWTKDAFNLAWAYFRVNKVDAAIRQMEQVFTASHDEKYIDMSKRAGRDLGYFYAVSGNVKKAINFFKENDMPVGPSLGHTARTLLNYGRYSAAEKVLTAALPYLEKEDRIAAQIELLELYERAGKTNSHLKTAQEIMTAQREGDLTPEQTKAFKVDCQRMAGILQKQIQSKTLRGQKVVLQEKTRQAQAYFKIMAELDEQAGWQYSFNLAETSYGAGKYNEALPHYHNAFQGAESDGQTKIANLALVGMMACLGQKEISKKNKDKYLEETYRLYLQRQQGKHAQSAEVNRIYQRLFSLYIERKDMDNAEKVLKSFQKRFPNDLKTQEAMVAQIMDFHKNQKDEGALREWIERLKDGEFKVSQKYLAALRKYVMSTQFDAVQKAADKGDKKEALLGYISLYKRADVTPEAKRNAAYNITLLFYELGDVRRTSIWMQQALKMMTVEEVREFEKSFFTVIGDIFNRQQLKTAAILYQALLEKLCKTSSTLKPTIYQNMVVIHLVEENYNAIEGALAYGPKCNIAASVTRSLEQKWLEALIDTQRWNTAEEVMQKLDAQPELWVDLIYPWAVLEQQYRRSGRTQLAQQTKAKVEKYYKYAQQKKLTIPLLALDAMAQNKLAALEKTRDQVQEIQLKFPEDVFKQQLAAKYKLLDQLNKDAQAIFATHSGRGIVRASKILVEAYEATAAEIANFTPPGKSENYVKSFRQGMQSVVNNTLAQANNFRATAKNQIIKNRILSNDNYWFLGQSSYPLKVEYDYGGGVIMDRGGRR